MNEPNDLESILFPRDERDYPAAVLYAHVGSDPTTAGKFVAVKADPITGALIVDAGATTPTFVDDDGNQTSALVTDSGEQVFILSQPLPAGSAIIGKFIQETRTPNFVMMHENITAADELLAAPLSAIGYNATGCSKLLIHISMSLGSSVKIRPVTWSTLFGRYIYGDPTPNPITESFELILDVYGVEDVYLLPFDIVGSVSIAVAGV